MKSMKPCAISDLEQALEVPTSLSYNPLFLCPILDQAGCWPSLIPGCRFVRCRQRKVVGKQQVHAKPRQHSGEVVDDGLCHAVRIAMAPNVGSEAISVPLLQRITDSQAQTGRLRFLTQVGQHLGAGQH